MTREGVPTGDRHRLTFPGEAVLHEMGGPTMGLLHHSGEDVAPY